MDLIPEADQIEIRDYLLRKNKKPADVWQPQEKQLQLLELCGLHKALYGGEVEPAVSKIIGYGGAAFGGKTEGMLGLALIALSQIPSVKIGYFRRTFTELEGSDGVIERAYALLPKIGAKYNEQKHVWRMIEPGLEDEDPEDWNKGRAGALRFCHLQHEKDVTQYQSSAFDIYLSDESTHFSWTQSRYMLTRNRRSKYCDALPRPFAVMCSNPGNIGHIWYMNLFGIDGELRKQYGRKGE